MIVTHNSVSAHYAARPDQQLLTYSGFETVIVSDVHSVDFSGAAQGITLITKETTGLDPDLGTPVRVSGSDHGDTLIIDTARRSIRQRTASMTTSTPIPTGSPSRRGQP